MFWSLLATLFLAGCGESVQESPSGVVRASVFVKDQALHYCVWDGERMLIDTSSMGVKVDGVALFSEVRLQPTRCCEVDESYAVMGGKSLSRNHYRTYTYAVTHLPTGYAYELETRLYDDGYAYRFILPGEGERTVDGEAAEWRVSHCDRVWFAERNSGWKLKTYAGEWIATAPDSLHCISSQGSVQTMPLLYRCEEAYVLISEAALYDYSGMRLRAEADGSLRADFTEPKGFSLSGDIRTPWRVTLIAHSLDELVNSDLITNLNPAPDPALFADMSWIRSGKSLWSWWSEIDGRFMTLEGEKEVIDIASSLGVEYSTIDEGWESKPDKWQFIDDLVTYGAERNVGLFVWRHWERLNDPTEDYAQMRGFLDSVAAHGIKGVKVDFMNGEGLRQIEFTTTLLRKAAERQLLVNFHGCQKPSGEIRTYPNELTREGVRGIELNRITANYEKQMQKRGLAVAPDRYVPGDENQMLPATHNAALPFTRGVVGAADYTPTAFTIPGKTTAAHQMAFALLLNSPLMTIAENPFVLAEDARYAAACELIRQMPTTWDETRVLPPSEVGELVFMARRKGDMWYLACINTKPTEVSIPAEFGGDVATNLQLFVDDGTGGLIRQTVSSSLDEPLRIRLTENSGFVLLAHSLERD